MCFQLDAFEMINLLWDRLPDLLNSRGAKISVSCRFVLSGKDKRKSTINGFLGWVS